MTHTFIFILFSFLKKNFLQKLVSLSLSSFPSLELLFADQFNASAYL